MYGGLNEQSEMPSALHLFHIPSSTWQPPIFQADDLSPTPRFAHLSTLVGDHHLVLTGGQQPRSDKVDETNVLDLERRRWIVRSTSAFIGRGIGWPSAVIASRPASYRSDPCFSGVGFDDSSIFCFTNRPVRAASLDCDPLVPCNELMGRFFFTPPVSFLGDLSQDSQLCKSSRSTADSRFK